MARPATIRRIPYALCVTALSVTALALACDSGIEAPPAVDLSTLDPDAASLVRDLREDAVARAADAEARGNLGLALETYGLLDAACDAFRQAAALAPSEPRWHYHLALRLAANGDLEGGLSRMDRALELAPDYPPAHWHSGEWLLELGEPLLAEAAFRQALVHDPATLAASAGLARVYLATDRPREALELLQAARRSGRPGAGADAYLHHLIGTAYRQLGMLDEAAGALARSRPVTPAWPDPWREARRDYRVGYAADLERAMDLIADGDVGRAVPLLERLRGERPDDVTLLSNLGAAYLDAGRVTEAKQALLTALVHQPEHFGSHLNLGAAFEAEGSMDLALGHVERAIAANPFVGHAHERRGALLLRQGRFDAAADAFRAAVDLEPGNLDAWLGLSRARLDAGQLAAAREALAAAAELDPHDRRVVALRATFTAPAGRGKESP